MDIDVEQQHAARLALIDPLLPPPAPLEGDLIVTTGAVASTELMESAPDSLMATWNSLRRHTLRVRLAGADLGPLLDRWEEHLAKVVTPGDDDTAAQIIWPSRDTAAVPALVRHGFAPLVTTSARRAGTVSSAPTAADVSVRYATKADLATCVALDLEVVRYDAQFGVLTERPSTEAGLRENMAEMLERDRPCIWLAERGGRTVGIVTVDFPPHSDWMAASTSASPMAYIGLGGVQADQRGGGVGGALVAQVHRELDDEGIAVTLLHHCLPNPRSTPFWHSQGYRPLWTNWQRRPALRA